MLSVRHRFLWILALGVAALSGCHLVDEDMGDCETNYDLDYELRMVTNMTTEIQTQLSLEADVQIAQTLRSYLDDVFTDYAHDVDLGFYDVVRNEAAGDSLRLHYESHIMDANQSSYTLYIPIRHYMHLAAANVAGSGLVSLENGGLCHAARLTQEVRDTIDSHRTGIFTARQQMNIQSGVSQEFNVSLYMANCATTLVLDTLGSHLRNLRVYATGFATGFAICDSTYLFQYTPYIRADRISVPESGTLCFSTVNFPSREPKQDPDTKVTIETDDPFVSERSEGSLWRYYVYATLPDGTVTETIVGVFTPLRAGQYKIIRAQVHSNGSLVTSDPTVGLSVVLNWTPGSEHEVEL